MKKNIERPNYERSILSVSSSIMKYYGVKSDYKSLVELDEILEKKYTNVIFLILDCLGLEILKNNLDENSILKQNLITNVTSVFPPTTAAVTIAFHSGISPYENGWIGWMPYFREHNRMVELFSGKDFYTRESIEVPLDKGKLKYKTIYEKICEKNRNVKFHKIFPSFVDGGADTFEELCQNIELACNNSDKNLISAYWAEPDHTIHYNGINSKEVKDILKDIDISLRKLSSKLTNSVIIISADHGAVDVEEVYLNEIKEIDDCLKMPPSIESRFVSFFVKDDKKDDFVLLMEKYFKGKYILYTKEEFLNDNLLGNGIKHDRINDYIGDYVFISTADINIRYSVTGDKDKVHLADHGGITREEMIVPVIVIESD